jgi:hypothetical protein
MALWSQVMSMESHTHSVGLYILIISYWNSNDNIAMNKQSRTLRRFRLTRSVVFVCSSDVLFAQCCQLFWIIHSWLSLRFSLTFIQFNWTMHTILVLYVTTLNMLALIISILTNKRIILSNRSYIASLIQSVTSLMQKQNKYIYACALCHTMLVK